MAYHSPSTSPQTYLGRRQSDASDLLASLSMSEPDEMFIMSGANTPITSQPPSAAPGSRGRVGRGILDGMSQIFPLFLFLMTSLSLSILQALFPRAAVNSQPFAGGGLQGPGRHFLQLEVT